MDARIDPLRALDVELGDAHVLRNGGAFVTDDVLRSLVLSQRLLETHSVVVMAHTQCGLTDLDEERLASDLSSETGQRPPFAFGSFHDVDEHVRTQVERVRTCPWLPHVDDVRGFVFDIASGAPRPVL